jgi:hypothetical protein
MTTASDKFAATNRDPATQAFIAADPRWLGGLRRGYSKPQQAPAAPLHPAAAPQPQWSVIDGINERMRAAATALPGFDAERQRLIAAKSGPRPSDLLFGPGVKV